MNAELLAFDLLARLHAVAGQVSVQQVDLVPCEDGCSTMACIYHEPLSHGDCTPLVFDTPPGFDAGALQAALTAHGTVH